MWAPRFAYSVDRGTKGIGEHDAIALERLIKGHDRNTANELDDYEEEDGTAHNTLRERELFAVQDTAVTCMELDPPENRFLLTGNAGGIVNLYDTERWYHKGSRGQSRAQGSDSNRSTGTAPLRSRRRYFQATGTSLTCEPLRSYGPETSQVGIRGHAATVSSVTWYTVDNGLFLTGGSDRRILAWDTNAFAPVFQFRALGQVHDTSMSLCAAMEGTPNYCLAAVASSDSRISLVDIKSCAATHTLVGHGSGGVMCLAWSPDDPYVLASGGRDGSVRLWDVRRGGQSACLDVLDANNIEQRGHGGVSANGDEHREVEDSASSSRRSQAFSSEYYERRIDMALEAVNNSEDRRKHPPKSQKEDAEQILPLERREHASVDERRKRSTNRAHSGAVTGLTFPSSSRVIPRLCSEDPYFTDRPEDSERAILVSTGSDDQIRVWDLEASAAPRCKLTKFKGYSGSHKRRSQTSSLVSPPSLSMSSIQTGAYPSSIFTPDTAGILLLSPNSATSSNAGITHAYDLVTGELLGSLDGHFGTVNTVCVRQASGSGRRPNDIPEIYSAGEDGLILCYKPVPPNIVPVTS
eukprot:gb/GECG01014513.1/.p1 GENE.gb/GECG01014513.1/~~gb/GECG01014513.1/.p1  ORF type:complete len:580 (+),score=60.34 gb/GECG01014513.1/:1-1740(+)